MKRRFTLLSLTLLLSVFFAASASAYNVEVDGIYYNYLSGENNLEVTSGDNEYTGDVVIPSSVVINGKEYSVTSIGDCTFYDCSGLTSVTIPESVTSIGIQAFCGCSVLTSVIIPNSVTSIGNYAFYGCSGLTSVIIPNSVTSIGDRTFYDCSGLTSVTIPESVTSIGIQAFYGCSGLTSVIIPNSVTSIGDCTFYGCSGLTSVTIPESVTSIGDGAFEGCSGLTSVTIPESVTSIGYQAFEGCSGLISVTIPESVTSIGNGAFLYCSGLTSVTIPESVTSIGDWAFSYCSGLTSVTIPNSVTSIGDGAFEGCSGLTSVTIPESVTNIGERAFLGCNGITKTIIVNDLFVFLPKGYTGHYSIPENITKIIGGAFEGCIGLTSVTIPISVTSIGNYAFYGCSGLTSITIPESVTNIGNGAFSGCSGLTSVTIPNSVTSIDYDSFKGCNSIKTLYYYCSVNPRIGSNSLSELYVGDNVSIVYDYFNSSKLSKIVLGKNVTQVRANAFQSSQIEEFTVTGEEPPYMYPNVFGTQDLTKATLYVPESKTEYYQTTEPWSKFGKVLTLSGETPAEPEKCATPTITYADGKLQFACETEGAECYYTITCPDVTTGETRAEDNAASIAACYDLTCQAKATGHANSDVATAKLYWLASSGSIGTGNINTAAMRGIAIQSANGFISISGLAPDEKVEFYSIDGKALGTAQSTDGSVTFPAKQGTVVVAKIGKESVKIMR